MSDTNPKSVKVNKKKIFLEHLTELSDICCTSVIGLSDIASCQVLEVFVLHRSL